MYHLPSVLQEHSVKAYEHVNCWWKYEYSYPYKIEALRLHGFTSSNVDHPKVRIHVLCKDNDGKHEETIKIMPLCKLPD